MPTITHERLGANPIGLAKRTRTVCVYDARTRRTAFVQLREIDPDRRQPTHLAMRELFGPVTEQEKGIQAALRQMRVGGHRQRGSEIDF